MSARLYLDTESEAATFAPGLIVEHVALKDDFNRIGYVQGLAVKSNKLLVSIGSYINVDPKYPMQVRFNVNDALQPEAAWIEDISDMVERALLRDDVHGGYLEMESDVNNQPGHFELFRWSDRDALVSDLSFQGLAAEVVLSVRAIFELHQFQVDFGIS